MLLTGHNITTVSQDPQSLLLRIAKDGNVEMVAAMFEIVTIPSVYRN